MVQPLTRETGAAVDENPGCDGQEFPCGAPALCSSFRLILQGPRATAPHQGGAEGVAFEVSHSSV